MDGSAARLRDPKPLTEDEVRALFPWVQQPLHTFIPRVQLDIALQQIASANRMNRASTWLMAAAIFVAVVQVVIAILVWKHPL